MSAETAASRGDHSALTTHGQAQLPRAGTLQLPTLGTYLGSSRCYWPGRSLTTDWHPLLDTTVTSTRAAPLPAGETPPPCGAVGGSYDTTIRMPFRLFANGEK